MLLLLLQLDHAKTRGAQARVYAKNFHLAIIAIFALRARTSR